MLLEGFLRELAKPCPVACDKDGRGTHCKCNAVLSLAAVNSDNGSKPYVRMRFHPFQVFVVRTAEAAAVVRQVGFDHRILHNLARGAWHDVWHDVALNGTIRSVRRADRER